MKKGRGYYCYIILPKGSGKPTKKIISNSPTPERYIRSGVGLLLIIFLVGLPEPLGRII